ncbi:MAG: radical SAM protein [Armatimonadia bacterium]
MTVDDLFERLEADGRRHPLTMSAELTYRCNFGCAHCFCRLPEGGPTPRPELTLQEWDRILGQAADEGVLFLTLTGGEPLLRPDFRGIWLAAVQRGILPELFTNAFLLDEETVAFLAEWTPRQVSITLYGASEETYRLMTGREGLHARVLAGVDLLVAAGVKVEVKTVITRRNVHELAALRAQSGRYQAIFKWDAELTGCLPESGGNPEAERLTPADVLQLELADPVRVAEWRRLLEHFRAPEPDDHRIFRCRVGERDFHVDPYGMLRPCLMLAEPGYDLRKGSVKEGWARLPELLAGIDAHSDRCRGCNWPQLCRTCPAHALLAGEDAGAPAPFLCELGHLRAIAYGLHKTVPD